MRKRRKGGLGCFTAVLVRRYRRAAPVARVTFVESPELCKTSITLQDGCFGAGALMRIAAMFVRARSPGLSPGRLGHRGPGSTCYSWRGHQQYAWASTIVWP